jgi:hypothetical protein
VKIIVVLMALDAFAPVVSGLFIENLKNEDERS